MSQEKSTGAGLPTLSKSTIWMINFGFLGVQTAFTLQSSQMSRIFQTIGADPNNLGWFFILPPLAGLIVQPPCSSNGCSNLRPTIRGAPESAPRIVCGTGYRRGGGRPAIGRPPPLHSYGRVRHSSSQLPSSA